VAFIGLNLNLSTISGFAILFWKNTRVRESWSETGNLIEDEHENEEEDECWNVHGGSVTKGYYRFLTLTVGDYRLPPGYCGGPRIVD